MMQFLTTPAIRMATTTNYDQHEMTTNTTTRYVLGSMCHQSRPFSLEHSMNKLRVRQKCFELERPAKHLCGMSNDQPSSQPHFQRVSVLIWNVTSLVTADAKSTTSSCVSLLCSFAITCKLQGIDVLVRFFAAYTYTIVYYIYTVALPSQGQWINYV